MRLFEQGHSFEEIDNTAMQDVLDVLSYWSGQSKVNEKRNKQKPASTSGKKGRRRRR